MNPLFLLKGLLQGTHYQSSAARGEADREPIWHCQVLEEVWGDGCIVRRIGSGRPSKITEEIKALVETKMCEDDEITACQLHMFLVDHGYRFSLRTILRCCTSLGWAFRSSAYCQLIREENKVKWLLQWAQMHIDDNFENVVWTDEYSVQLETYRWFCCRKWGEPPRCKPRYVWFHFCVIACLSSLERLKLDVAEF